MTNINVKAGDLVRILPDTYPVRWGYADAGTIVEVGRVYEDESGIEVSLPSTRIISLEHNEYALFDEKEEEAAQPDMVEHPAHYRQGRFETIELIQEIAGSYDDGYVAYCVGNAIKYLARAPFKHEFPTEDLQKAKKYLDFAIKGLTKNE